MIRTALKRVGYAAAALGAAALLYGALTLPAARVVLDAPSWRPSPSARGVFHVHTRRSDGAGTVDEIAAAASRAGLQFVIFTDHGDGTRRPDPPAYRAGVLCLDGVEISTSGGHYAAIGLPEAPYPLGGDPGDVVEDVARLGGIGVIAHPASAKAGLEWEAWEASFDALEWLNADSEWRDEPGLRLAGVAARYLLRAPESLASLLDRPDAVLERWDRLTTRRRVVALAGVDAHARLRLGGSADPYDRGVSLPVPSYEAAFRVFSLTVNLPDPPIGDAARDARDLLAALRDGRAYTVLDALASPGILQFTAAAGPRLAGVGEILRADGPLEIRVRSNAPPDATTLLLRDGAVVDSRPGNELSYRTGPEPHTYRVEVRLARAPGTPAIPWLVSNPIYANLHPAAISPPIDRAVAPAEIVPLLIQERAGEWHVEHGPSSNATIELREARDSPSLTFTAVLGPGRPAGQFAAAACALRRPDRERVERVAFRGRADRPCRLSVQLRAPAAGRNQRWRRSVYLDATPRNVVVAIGEMAPVGTERLPRPEAAEVDTLLFVVDTVNLKPGDRRTIVLERVALERRPGVAPGPAPRVPIRPDPDSP